MSKNVFDKIGDIKNNVNRNNFDWSHDNNLTTGFGRITPVFCQQLPPGSSLRINPSFALQFMPMMFPVQTKCKAYLSFYRMPLRAMWKDYQDWVSSPNDQTNDLEPPYISFDSSLASFREGGILGVPGLVLVGGAAGGGERIGSVLLPSAREVSPEPIAGIAAHHYLGAVINLRDSARRQDERDPLLELP